MKALSPTLLTLLAAIIAVVGFASDAAIPEKGGDGGGNGASSISQSSNALAGISSDSGSQGALASDLKKANGAIHASNSAWANANGVPRIARTMAEAQAGLDSFTGDIDELRAYKAALESEVSKEDYQTQIDELELADFEDQQAYDDEVARLEGLREDPATRADADIAAELGPIQAEIDEYESYEEDKAEALAGLIGDRELSPEAIAELERRVREYLKSDDYQSSIVTTTEEPPAE